MIFSRDYCTLISIDIQYTHLNTKMSIIFAYLFKSRDNATNHHTRPAAAATADIRGRCGFL